MRKWLLFLLGALLAAAATVYLDATQLDRTNAYPEVHP